MVASSSPTGSPTGTGSVWSSPPLGLAVSNTATWYLSVVFDRTQRRFRDRVSIALESHVADLQASVATIEHQERPEYLDRLSVLRDQVFTLDHLFLSLFSTLGWVVRLAVTLVLLISIHPGLVLLFVAALPIVWTASGRPAVERQTEEASAPHNRLARHLFSLGPAQNGGAEGEQMAGQPVVPGAGLLRPALDRRSPGGRPHGWGAATQQQHQRRVDRHQQRQGHGEADDPAEGGEQRQEQVVEGEHLVAQHRQPVEVLGSFLVLDGRDRRLQLGHVGLEGDRHPVAEPALARSNTTRRYHVAVVDAARPSAATITRSGRPR